MNYWLEYLDIVFFFKCKACLINWNVDDLVGFCSGRSRRGSSGFLLKNNFARTSLFRDSYFVRISNLWYAIPEYIKSESLLESFKKKLKSFFYKILTIVFTQDDIRSYKLVCPKCHRLNIFTSCTCWNVSYISTILYPFHYHTFFCIYNIYVVCYLLSRLFFCSKGCLQVGGFVSFFFEGLGWVIYLLGDFVSWARLFESRLT